MKGRRLLIGLAGLLLATAPIAAQKNNRRVFVAALSANGAPILDLATSDFHVTENGADRPVTRAALATGPMRIVLLVDASTSMAPMLNDFRSALTTFVNAVPPEHEIAFITISGQLRVRVPPTTDREKLLKAIATLSSDGGANVFVDALLESDKRFLKSAPDKWPVFVIVTTDANFPKGEPPIDEYNAMSDDLIARGGSAHAVVIRGTQAGNVNTEVARNLTGNLGGIFEQVAITNSLSDYLRRIAGRLAIDHQAMATRYEVEYSSSAKGPQVPAVEVSVSRPSVRLQLSSRRPF
jgi:hypothetical protein